MSNLDDVDELEGFKEPGADADHARMWPRAVFDRFAEDGKKGYLAKTLELLEQPGVYVLYRDDIPYYVGQADRLWKRLHQHAAHPGGRHDLFWNYFSVFIEYDRELRSRIEAILITAMPTSNSARPRMERSPYPKAVIRLMRDIRRSHANPMTGFGKE